MQVWQRADTLLVSTDLPAGYNGVVASAQKVLIKTQATKSHSRKDVAGLGLCPGPNVRVWLKFVDPRDAQPGSSYIWSKSALLHGAWSSS